MKKIDKYEVISNRFLNNSVFELVLKGDTTWMKPGQFMNINVEGNYLKRPISLCNYDETTVTLLIKIVGDGTKKLSLLEKGDVVEALVDGGNGFSLNDDKEVVVVGGGIGIAPLYKVVQQLEKNKVQCHVFLGFRNKDDAFYVDEFTNIATSVTVVTEDGSLGLKGYVHQGIIEKNKTNLPYYTCGPLKMMEAVASTCSSKGQLSFEEKMGCGFGVCMGCSKKVKNGTIRLCVEGPVIESENVLWNEI